MSERARGPGTIQGAVARRAVVDSLFPWTGAPAPALAVQVFGGNVGLLQPLITSFYASSGIQQTPDLHSSNYNKYGAAVALWMGLPGSSAEDSARDQLVATMNLIEYDADSDKLGPAGLGGLAVWIDQDFLNTSIAPSIPNYNVITGWSTSFSPPNEMRLRVSVGLAGFEVDSLEIDETLSIIHLSTYTDGVVGLPEATDSYQGPWDELGAYLKKTSVPLHVLATQLQKTYKTLTLARKTVINYFNPARGMIRVEPDNFTNGVLLKANIQVSDPTPYVRILPDVRTLIALSDKIPTYYYLQGTGGNTNVLDFSAIVDDILSPVVSSWSVVDPYGISTVLEQPSARSIQVRIAAPSAAIGTVFELQVVVNVREGAPEAHRLEGPPQPHFEFRLPLLVKVSADLPRVPNLPKHGLPRRR